METTGQAKMEAEEPLECGVMSTTAATTSIIDQASRDSATTLGVTGTGTGGVDVAPFMAAARSALEDLDGGDTSTSGFTESDVANVSRTMSVVPAISMSSSAVPQTFSSPLQLPVTVVPEDPLNHAMYEHDLQLADEFDYITPPPNGPSELVCRGPGMQDKFFVHYHGVISPHVWVPVFNAIKDIATEAPVANKEEDVRHVLEFDERMAKIFSGHFGCWQPKMEKPMPIDGSKETTDTLARLTSVMFLLRSPAFLAIAQLVEGLFTRVDPAASTRYKNIFELFVDPHTKMLFQGGQSTFPMVVVTVGQLVLRHRDLKDVKQGWCAVVCLGLFEGGDMCFPDLEKRVQFRPGDFAKGGEVIDFITEGLLCHAIIKKEPKYAEETTLQAIARVACELVANVHRQQGDIFENMMGKNSAAADSVLFHGKQCKLSADTLKKRDSLRVAMRFFAHPGLDVLTTYSSNKSSNLYRLLGSVRRYLYFLRDENLVQFDHDLCSNVALLFQSIARKVLLVKFDEWIREQKRKIYADEAHLLQDLDDSDDLSAADRECEILTEEAMLQQLIEAEEPSVRRAITTADGVNPNSMLNMLTNIDIGLRHAMNFFGIDPLEGSFEDSVR
ncbi:hypothetical protein HK405_005461, partial [Cladochytrium tenue]